MPNEIIPASKELQDADAALRRAAKTAKRLAEQNGTPYVVSEVIVKNMSLKHAAIENKQ